MKPFELEELDQLDPACCDSVTVDRLIHQVRTEHEIIDLVRGSYSHTLHQLVAIFVAELQGEADEAVQWLANGTWQWMQGETLEELAEDPWAHDWRKFWNSRDFQGMPTTPCNICGAPSTIRGARLAACGDRHWRALQGTLPDEQCRLCNEVRVCAHDLDGSPVCTDCWPGEKLLADRRAAWRKQLLGDQPAAAQTEGEA
jgi:hypothetical protein